MGGEAVARLDPAVPLGREDRARTLLCIYELHMAPVAEVGEAAVLQWHPVLVELKARLEHEWIAELDALPPQGETGAALRTIAARDRIPHVYEWLARRATWHEMVEFLALEGGPDAGFDDLVAVCQLGLSGRPKLELATNYWDEMGNGRQDAVHTTLHDRMAEALGVARLDESTHSVESLERSALGGLFATNRWLQPEMLGALCLIEMQAGPRCRKVIQAFDRLGAPSEAYPFYRVHAEVDPIHGRDWLENAVQPLVDEHPSWGPRVVRGAWWRSQVNAAFFDSVRACLDENVPTRAPRASLGKAS